MIAIITFNTKAVIRVNETPTEGEIKVALIEELEDMFDGEVRIDNFCVNYIEDGEDK